MTSSPDSHTDTPTLEGKRAIITGGSTGIGRAIAILLASEGVDVFLCGLEQQYLDDALADVRSVGKGDGVVIDLADPDNVKVVFDQAAAYLGGLDIAVVNAAISADALSETSEADLRRAIAIDFTAYLLSAHAAADKLAGEGDIVLIGSMSAHVLGPESTIYAGIKYGIQGFSEALRRELGPKGIKVSLVEPGKTGSNMQYPDIPTEKQREMIEEHSMLRAEDIAVGVHYLLTQPRRTVIQQLTIAPRMQSKE
jgi:NAD(P)-dependent dehydrogenase (short-subunit alcohol dehydrogenase family)